MTVAGSDESEQENIDKELAEVEEDDFTGFDEAAGLPFSITNGTSEKSLKVATAIKKRVAKQKKEDQELERQKLMMSRKKRKLFEKMQYSNVKKDAEAEKLRRKRRKLENTRT